MTLKSNCILTSFRARPQFTVSLCCVLAAGLFIWFKLRLVTGMPRTANAVPREVAGENGAENKAGARAVEGYKAVAPKVDAAAR